MPGWESGDEPFDEEPIEAEEELALADGEERLPWLESDDEYEQQGPDTGRMLAFAAVGLLAIVALVGGAAWFLRGGSGEALVADGSVIEAPAEPYRTRPEDPGGAQVAGTGETSFEVAEGKAVEGRIAGSGTVPNPSIDRDQAAPNEPKPETASAGVGVQVGAYSARDAAEAGWATLSGRIEALQGRNHRIVQGVADSGTIYRLQAVAGSLAEAETLCRSIKSQGGDCQIKR